MGRGRLLWAASGGHRARRRSRNWHWFEGIEKSLLLFIAAAAFVGLFFVKVPFPLVVVGAALIG